MLARCSRYSLALSKVVSPGYVERSILRHFAELAPNTKERIEKIIKSGPVVVFMKGVPEDPRCGFSRAVVLILEKYRVDFNYIDVLEDLDIRQGIKDYSNWPTIPQIYMNGEFIGGCDILVQMHKDGEIEDLLKKHGLLQTKTTPASDQSGNRQT